MLSLSRREGESIEIDLGDYVDPSTPVGKVFANGPLTIRVFRIRHTDVRLAIDAPPGLVVLPQEVTDADETTHDTTPMAAATGPNQIPALLVRRPAASDPDCGADTPRRVLRLRGRS